MAKKLHNHSFFSQENGLQLLSCFPSTLGYLGVVGPSTNHFLTTFLGARPQRQNDKTEKEKKKEKREKKKEKKKTPKKEKTKKRKTPHSAQAPPAHTHKATPTRRIQTLMLCRKTFCVPMNIRGQRRKIAPPPVRRTTNRLGMATCIACRVPNM